MNGARDLAAEIDTVRRELRSLRDEAHDLGAELTRAQRQSAQAQALAAEVAHEGTRMEHLERVLDLAAVTAHVQQAIGRAPLAEGIARPVLVDGLLPPAVQQAAVAAIPAPIFRDDDRGDASEIPVPPKVAPTYVVATWMFLNDLAKDLIGPALLARVTAPSARPQGLEVKLARSVLVRSQPAEPLPDQPGRGDILTLTVHLGEYDWHVGFKWGARPASAPRRRHGDIASWSPLDSGGRS
jgi:hypothetical protein